MKIIDIEIDEKRETDKLLIIGNKYADVTPICVMLEQSGVIAASPSKNEKLTAKEISQIILKSQKNKGNKSKKNITIPKVWDSLLLDLYRGNIDHRLWYWEDTNALDLLEYYKSLDDSLSFVLVYDEPKNTILNYLEQNEKLKPKELNTLMEYWLEYNQKLLGFFYKNRERSLLINATELERMHTKQLKRLSRHIGLPLSAKKISKGLTKSKQSKRKTEGETALFNFMIEALSVEYPEVVSLYDEMQSVANVYHSENTLKKIRTKKAFCEMVNLYKSDALLVKMHEKKSSLEKELQDIENEKSEKEKIVQKTKEENEQLLTQLMQIQEELEKYYLENQSLKNKIEEKKRYYGAAERVKQQLSYRLGATMIEKSKSFGGITSLPFALLKVRSQYKKEMKEREKQPKLPPIHTYADAYDAEHVKKHLSYRLGETMIETLKNPLGLFVLPFRLNATYKAFKKEREA